MVKVSQDGMHLLLLEILLILTEAVHSVQFFAGVLSFQK
jgi:hypothetical protein